MTAGSSSLRPGRMARMTSLEGTCGRARHRHWRVRAGATAKWQGARRPGRQTADDYLPSAGEMPSGFREDSTVDVGGLMEPT